MTALPKLTAPPSAAELATLAVLHGNQPDPDCVNHPPLADLIAAVLTAAGTAKFGVFAYGSLMWSPDFSPEFAVPATLPGYSRQPCVCSTCYRGTPDYPGLVFGLAAGGSCHGLALGIPVTGRQEIVQALFARECFQGVYWPLVLPVELDAGGRVPCLAFTVNTHSATYAPPQPAAAVRAIVQTAEGQKGPCIEYWQETAAKCKELGITWDLDHIINDA